MTKPYPTAVIPNGVAAVGGVKLFEFSFIL